MKRSIIITILLILSTSIYSEENWKKSCGSKVRAKQSFVNWCMGQMQMMASAPGSRTYEKKNVENWCKCIAQSFKVENAIDSDLCAVSYSYRDFYDIFLNNDTVYEYCGLP